LREPRTVGKDAPGMTSICTPTSAADARDQHVVSPEARA
jgi:hypothetical protein